MAGILVVFDFDKTLINSDSDAWVLDWFGLSEMSALLLPALPWNALMDRMMGEIHSRGRTVEDLKKCLEAVSIHPSIASAIRAARAYGCDLKIVSDANTFFIHTVLKQHGLLDCFSEICTNPCFIDQDGRLRISPYYEFSSSSHGCKICPPNMCKGLIMTELRDRATADGVKRFIFVGDGAPDLCAGLSLQEGDCLMGRRGFPVTKLIKSNPAIVKAQVQEWSYGDEFEITLLHLINKAAMEDAGSNGEQTHIATPIVALTQVQLPQLAVPAQP